MEAMVSGSAGIAVVLCDLHAIVLTTGGSGDNRRTCGLRDLARILEQAGDWDFLEDVTEDFVRDELVRAERTVQGIHIALMLMDGRTSDRAAALAAQDFAILFSDPIIEERVERVLFARPLPKGFSTSLAEARLAAAKARSSSRFFSTLDRAQPAIVSVCAAWDHAPSPDEGAHVDLTGLFARQGVFRRLVLGILEDRPSTVDELVSLSRLSPITDQEKYSIFSGVLSAVSTQIQEAHPIRSKALQTAGEPSSLALTDPDDVGFRRGDRAILEKVYKRNVRLVERVLVDSLRQQGWHPKSFEVADLIQEVFVRAFSANARSSFNRRLGFGHYLMSISRNILLDHVRSRRTESSLPGFEEFDALNLLSGESSWDEASLDIERSLDVTRAVLRDLSPDLAAIYQQRFVLGRSQKPAADALKITVREVRRGERALRSTLAKALKEAYGDARRSSIADSAEVKEPERPFTRRHTPRS